MTEQLKPCPFCGEVPEYPDGRGTQYIIECGECGCASVSIQICDLMTLDERMNDKFIDYTRGEEYISRAKEYATKMWNTRIN